MNNLSGENQNLSNGHYFNPKRIFYTGYNNQNGNYQIEFNYNENQLKPNIIINARLGLKQLSPYLLSDIQVFHQSQLIRSYELGYIEGEFRKTLLDFVAEKNQNGDEFYRHTFEYYDDIAENGGNLFKPVQTISLPDVDPSYSLSGLAGAINGESVISTNENIQKGFDIRPSAGMEIRIPVHSNNKSRTVTVGADFGENNTKSKGKISLIDINGDGLDDIVYRNNNGLQFYPNSVNFDSSNNGLINSFASTSKSVNQVNDFYRSDSRTKKMFAESWSVFASGFYAATSRYKTESETSIFFTDANQDGLTDVVKGGEVYFNYLNADGEPNFTTDSGLTENMVLTAGSPVSNWQDPTETEEEEQEEEEQQEMQENFLDFDAVQVWKAPFSGVVNISNRIKVYVGSSPFHHTIETKSGIYSNDPFRIFQDQYSPGVNGDFTLQSYFGNTPPLGVQYLGLGDDFPIKVEKGQEIYYRYHNPDQGSSYFGAEPVINYLNVNDIDENGKDVSAYDYRDYFHLTSNGLVRIPGSGLVNISWSDFTINKPSDNVYVRVYEVSGENESIIYEQYCPAGVVTTVSNNLNSQLYQQTNLPLSFKFEVFSDSNVLWENINWQPMVTYAPDQAAQNNQQVPNIPQEFRPVPKYSIFYASNNSDEFSQNLSNYTNWNNTSQNFGIKPNKDIINSGNLDSSDNGEFLLVVKKGGIPVGKRIVKIKNGQIILPDDSPINIHNGLLSNWSGNIYFSYYVTGKINKEVYQKYLLAVGETNGVLLDYNWLGNSLKLNAVSYFNDLSNYGSMYGNFGQFYYNDHYDDSLIPEDNIGKLINQDLLQNVSNNYNFDLITINCDEESSDFEECAQQAIENQMNLPDENTDFSDPNAVESVINNLEAWMNNNPSAYIPEISFIPANAKSTGILDEDRWEGIDSENQYFDKIGEVTIGNVDPSSTGGAGGASIGSVSGEINDNDTEGPNLASNNVTGMKAIEIKRKSSRRTMSAGYNPIAISSFVPGYSNTLTGFMDWNGDGYPDIWYVDNLVVSNMTGGLKNPSGDHNFGVLNAYNNWGIAVSASGSDAYTQFTASSAEGSDASSTKGNKYSIGNPTSQIGITANVIGQNKEEQFFLDLNGDGLPDRIKEINDSYLYQLNKGQVTSNNNYEIFQNLTYSESSPTLTSSSLGGSLDFSNLFPNAIPVSLNAGISESQTNTKTAFQDINGDGLIDIIESDGNLEGSTSSVKFNYGNKFANQDYSLTASSSIVNLKRNYQDVIIGADGDAGVFFGFPICCWIIPAIHVKFGVNLGGNISENVTVQTKDFRDLNGDGFADYIVQYSNDEINVNYSAIGRTNKLKSINNPLGGKVTIDYKPQSKSYNNPKTQWVMSEITIEDGYDLANSGFSEYSKFFEYENAYYDRRERLSYGFETIKTFEYLADSNGNISEDIYRTKIDKFHNKNYFLKGKLKESIFVKGEWDEANPDNIFTKTINEYALKEIGNDGLIDVNSDLSEDYDVGGTEGRQRAAVLLEKSTTENYELTTTPIVSEITMEYDGLGRITKYYDNGDISDNNDNYYSEISYFEDPALEQNNILNIPLRIQVFDNNGNQKRDRSVDELDFTTGAIKKVGVKLNSSQVAQTTMDYDQYGNLIKIFYPENLNGEEMYYIYNYDNVEHKFLKSVGDAFGYESFIEYDYLYDVITKETDISGNEINYTYDDFGRLTVVLGPKEQADSKPYTIKFDYYPKEQDLNQMISIPSGEQFLPVAVTSHYDYEHPNNPIKTYAIMDGLGRVRQTKKELGGDIVNISGWQEYDEFSRVVNEYQSTGEGEGIENYFIKTDIPSYFSTIEYDELDRNIKVTNAAGNSIFNIPGIGNNFFKTETIVEQNSAQEIITEKFTDVRGRVIQEKKIGDPNGEIITNFTYNAIGELMSYADGDDITSSYEYDLAGRKTKYTNPDKGITTYEYDRAGNLTSLITANLAQGNEEITFKYEFNRLIEENYPDMPNGSNISNVTYQYGSLGNGNETGRLIQVIDATGSQSFEYGNMGEVISNTRTVVGPNIPTRYFTTNFNYDSWNRLKNIEYPDGENVVYSYDEGGNLFSIIGDYPYIKEIYYTFFESPEVIIHGNNTVTKYDYTNDLRNLNNYSVELVNGDMLLNLDYSYDKINNVVRVGNDVPTDPSNIGGKYQFRYGYDKLNRLQYSDGGFVSEFQNNYSDISANYLSELTYTKSQGILSKKQQHSKNGNIESYNTYENSYKYIDNTHKIEAIIDESTLIERFFTYDLNGNLINIANAQEVETQMFWDESNRLRVLEENGVMHHYLYDYTGERVLKASSSLEQIYENGTLANQSSVQFNPYTTYASPYIVINPQGVYTKHYFNGSKRIATAIGSDNAIIFETPPSDSEGRSLPMGREKKSMKLKPKELQQQQIADLQLYAQKADRGSVTFKKYESKKDSLSTEGADESSLKESEDQIAAAPEFSPVYYYHANHLGSNTGITTLDGAPYQFFLNLPFGETLAEQYSDSPGLNIPYKFNGKELDQETGNYYYGARYYNPKWSVWLSIDPLAEEFPGWSPYAYTMNNPINMVDPTGMAPETIYENADTGEKVEVKDGIDKTLVVNDSDFQEAKFFANEISKFGNSKEIANAYLEFYNEHNYYDGFSSSNLYDYLFVEPEIHVFPEFLGSSGGLDWIGGPASQGLKNSGKPLAKYLEKILKIQKHHIIPKGVYKNYKAALSPFMKLNSGFNLKKLPTPFHGNHPQYNEYVGKLINQLGAKGNINAGSLRNLQKQLSKEINRAYDSGMKLNDYFRGLNSKL